MPEKKPGPVATIRVGVDTGGTFTDFVFFDGQRIGLFKLPSTPADPCVAILEGLKRILSEANGKAVNLEVIHGTTVGTNAILEGRGARTALITTAGFEDVIEIGRQARPALYDLGVQRPPSLVPRALRFGLKERVTATGETIVELKRNELRSLKQRLRTSGAESIAICLLFSFVDSKHEKMTELALDGLGIPMSVSHRLLPEYREYERTSTVVINAYLQPLVGSYLGRLQREIPSFRVMQSSGGSISAAAAGAEPVRTILSGPAGGVAGAISVAKASRTERIITFDMGGTSTDVALCESGAIRMTNESLVAGMPVAVSMMDIHTVGAGGGSIARVDQAGSLKVGPESAGADPGPACYGRGTLPTVTDANLVLGRFGGDNLLGGDFKLDLIHAQTSLKLLAEDLGRHAGRKVSVNEAAAGVIQVVNVNMERAIRQISVERGYDPRDFSLIPFGGAGGLHAVDLARACGIPTVIAPTSAGALSALGALSSDVLKESSRTLMLTASAANLKVVRASFVEMRREAKTLLEREGFKQEFQRHDQFLSARYLGQSFELEIPWGPNEDVKSVFNQAHEKRYGHSQPDNTIELVSVRLRSRGLVERMPSKRTTFRRRIAAKTISFAKVVFGGRPLKTAVYSRDNLKPGMTLSAPAVVTEYSSTTLIPPESRAFMDEFGNIVINL